MSVFIVFWRDIFSRRKFVLPSIFVILVIMALFTIFMTTPLLHLVEHIFVRREEKLSLKHKLKFCFGRLESGHTLLSIYNLLFGKQLKKNHLIAAHYTIGTDLNPLNAEHYASGSFALLNQREAIIVRICRELRGSFYG